jgi:hypothetical protein
MSYCRWSSDAFGCDVYVYEDVNGGYTCHVARRRMSDREGEPAIPDIRLILDDRINEYMDIHKVWDAWRDTKELVNIGLNHDGESFNVDTAGDMADLLIELKTMGYHVPQYAIDSLQEESLYEDKE